MLKRNAFASSLAVTTAVIYVAFYVLQLVAPSIFVYLYNAQFLGAEAASLFPGTPSFGEFIGVLITIAVTSWVVGHIWAALYNKYARG